MDRTIRKTNGQAIMELTIVLGLLALIILFGALHMLRMEKNLKHDVSEPDSKSQMSVHHRDFKTQISQFIQFANSSQFEGRLSQLTDSGWSMENDFTLNKEHYFILQNGHQRKLFIKRGGESP